MAVFKSYSTASGKSISALLSAFGAKAESALGAELYAEAEGIMAQSKPLVPVDTGALRASGYVAPPRKEEGRVVVELGYGGVAARANPKTGQSTDVYAIYVHEDLEAHHKVGVAKFLEIPFDAARKGMVGRVANGIKARLKSGDVGNLSGAAAAGLDEAASAPAAAAGDE